MISLGMEHSDNNDIDAFNPVKRCVWKSVREHPPKTPVINGGRSVELLRTPMARLISSRNCPPKSGRCDFVAAGGFAQVLLGFGTKNKAPTHGWTGWRRRDSTSFHSAPTFGFAWYSSNSRSSSAFLSASSGAPLSKSASSISQMRSRISRRSPRPRSGNRSRISDLLMAVSEILRLLLEASEVFKS